MTPNRPESPNQALQRTAPAQLIMSARKRIFTGAMTLTAGVLLQILVGFRASSLSGPIRGGMIDSGRSAEQMDHLLEQSHLQMFWMFAAWILGWLLIAAGAIWIIWGVSRHFLRKKPMNETKSPRTNA